jgi:hypothetical protein
MIRRHFRLRRRILIGLAFAAVTAVPVAQATPYVSAPHDPALVSTSSKGIEVVSENGSTSAQLSQLEIEGLRWQAMARPYHVQQPTLITTEHSYGASKPSPAQTPVLASAPSGGFDWTDAGIGASVAFGGVLVLVSGLFVLRRRFDETGLTSA